MENNTVTIIVALLLIKIHITDDSLYRIYNLKYLIIKDKLMEEKLIYFYHSNEPHQV